MSEPSLPVIVVGVLSTDVVEGGALHLRPPGGPGVSLALPAGWRQSAAEIRDDTGAVVARLGDRVAVAGNWVEGMVSLRGPGRVLRVRTVSPAPDRPAF